MTEKKYLIDAEPSSSRDLIRMARKLDENYGIDGWCLTSEAARILRVNGHEVKDNPFYGVSHD